MYRRFLKDKSRCVDCGFCSSVIRCPSPERCIGCEACYLGCPYEAIVPADDFGPRKTIKVTINGEKYDVPEYLTVKTVLETVGYRFTRFPEKSAIFTPCGTGGCYSCAVLINGELKPSCHTKVEDGMAIETDVTNVTPLRIIEGFTPHSVGGVGTPYYLKGVGRYIEVACFAAGCNLRCKTCQNFFVTYDSVSIPLTPREAALKLTSLRRKHGVDRMAISGGEPTINRRWLLEFFKELRRLNRDGKARLHLDTNTTVLTRDYIDELVEVGITDIGPDLKALNLETFQLITGIDDKELAMKYLETSWEAVKYIADNYYPEKVFMGIGIPYNKLFHPTMDELFKMGQKIAEIDPEIQVCVLDYRPEFRRRDIKQPTPQEMLQVKRILEAAGLKTVIVQTTMGHIGP